MVKGILVEVIGEPEMGKTHFCCGADNSVLLDTTPSREGESIAMKVYEDGFYERYFPVSTMQMVRDAYYKAVELGATTLAVDWGLDLRVLAAKEWIEEESARKKEKVRAVYPVSNYQYVHTKIRNFMYNVANGRDKSGKGAMNLILTAGFRDEYINDKKSGNRERSGYTRMDFYSDIRIYLYLWNTELTQSWDSGNDFRKGRWIRRGKVIKNRFVDRIDENYITDIDNISFDKVMEMIPVDLRELVGVV